LVDFVDSSDQQRFQEARDKLLSIIKCNEEDSLPFVIVANKSDILTAAKSSELIEELDLHAIYRQQWSIQSTSAMTGDGIMDVMQQLAKMIKD
jgi:signal recognition particle receptor subunit beta